MNRIELIPATIEHFPALSSEVQDEKFLMQWAGPKYTFPLSWEQVNTKILETDEHGRKNFLYTAKLRSSSEIIGHVQLTIIDRITKTGNIASVLVYAGFRNKGLGKEIMLAIMNVGFNDFHLNGLQLGVFDFNTSAMGCYSGLGFKQFNSEKETREVGNERWNVIRMKINKEDFQIV